MTVDRLIVIGAGAMGRGIAQVAAASGCRVSLHDAHAPSLEDAVAAIRRQLARAVEKGKLSENEVEATVDRIDTVAAFDDLPFTTTLFVIEAVVEQRDVKKDVLARASERVNDRTVLASNTSTISITELAGATVRSAQVIGMHYFNPVPVMTLVEVVEGLNTSAATVAATEAFAKQLGKTPLRVKDSPGFVSNRVLMPLINEAAYCVMEGVADTETIDAVMQLGCNHPMGPLALADLIGLDVCLNILDVLHRDLGDPKFRPCPLLRTLVHAGRLGRKTGTGFHCYSAD